MRRVHLPKDLDDLWSVLEREPDAVVLAGGTDVLARMHHREIAPSCLVALEHIDALRGVQDFGGEIRIGSTTTLSALAQHPLLSERYGVLVGAARSVGSPAIRHVATLGGNIVTASPAGDTLPALHVLEADLELVTRGGRRRVPVARFVRGPGQVDLELGEILSAIWLRRPAPHAIHHFEKVALRNAQACSMVSLAALVDLRADGTVKRARLAWGAVAPTVWTSPAVERALEGRRLDESTLREVGEVVEAGVQPVDDVRATARYRRKVAGNLLSRLALHGPRGSA